MAGVGTLGSVRRRLGRALVAGSAIAVFCLPTAADAAPDDETVEIDPDSGLVPIPLGCPVPQKADVAFVGTVVDKDGFIAKGTVRFTIEQIRAGSARGYSLGSLIDVRYGPDSQYLEIGETYLVAAAIDPEIGALASKVSPSTPLFGGDAVVGLEDTETECPDIDDPVMTLHPDGTSVDSGLLKPLLEDKRLLLAVIGVPAAVVGVVLVGLVLLRRLLSVGFQGVFALGRKAVTPTSDHRAARVRAHQGR